MDTIYRAENIGSLVRPAYLNEARMALRRGALNPADFKQIEDRAVAEAVALQERAGLDVVTDGEMRRLVYTAPGSGAAQRSGAPSGEGRRMHWRRKEGDTRREQDTVSHASYITAKLQFSGSLAAEEFSTLAGRTQKPIKVALPSPTAILTRWSPQASVHVYPDPVELLADAAEMLRQEIRALAALGCRYVQIDAPELCGLADEVRSRELSQYHPQMCDWMRNQGIEALNSVATVSGVTMGLHMCRGNHQGFWLSEAPWEALAREILPRTPNFDIFLLEYDDWRAGSFEPLRDIPAGKIAVLGLISTKREELEPAGQIEKRIDEAARFFPRERLALSTQCGFAPAADGSVVSIAGEEAKLRLVADIAHRVWR